MAGPPPEDFPTAARIVGVIYLTLCSAVGGGVFLFWHPDSIYCRLALGVAVVSGLILALLARIKDPSARPVRWGLLWLALGFVLGPCLVFGLTYLAIRLTE
ncbi:MAG TPA: hypothetical protein VFE78_38270 [Gemmataceae bacterium]|jgi:drug/metabolite transporter (DMT)-like permease|nr:hypothetical protein [Gemmataceae bacterium]